MYYSGISDEAGQDIDTQIEAHRELGWRYVELRTVGRENITAMSDEAFDRVCGALASAGLHASCFASAIADWARPITCDPMIDIDDLARAIPRMRRLSTPYIRIMSYPNDDSRPLSEKDWRNEAIARTKTLAKMAEDGGVTLLHENCAGWGGLSAENSAILLGEVDSPALRIVFDTGNPVTCGQDPWEYYKTVEKDIAYVHIKDARRVSGKDEYAYCGEGDSRVADILADLIANDYDDGVSIEPHLAAVIHTGQQDGNAQEMYDSYTEYGRRLMGLVERIASETG
ncbi:MAG: sugar phosphate isomerase/epimerase family protein [Candidatus Hydrogenedentes bacterium]|jgi:sugar phosphate isomerase/epimerase|nr:sugar phosphate isomerase/epimerase family protein [Candidatus Hydrogenedentota bacterium]